MKATCGSVAEPGYVLYSVGYQGTGVFFNPIGHAQEQNYTHQLLHLGSCIHGNQIELIQVSYQTLADNSVGDSAYTAFLC